jgi:hypothetical protein
MIGDGTITSKRIGFYCSTRGGGCGIEYVYSI